MIGNALREYVERLAGRIDATGGGLALGQLLAAVWLVPEPLDWVELVNRPQTEELPRVAGLVRTLGNAGEKGS